MEIFKYIMRGSAKLIRPVLLILTHFLVMSSSVKAAPAGLLDFSVLDALVEAQMQKHGLPGVAIAIIEGEEIVYLQGYGNAGRNRPMTPQTQMFIGSQSKSFTALAIAQLADQGKLDLDAPVQTYIPWFRVNDEEASAKITVRHLLKHSSGLSDAGFPVVLANNTTLEESVRALEKARLTQPIGSTFQYFNMGYSVLAYIIELTSGESYADYIQAHILSPLGMNNSTADPSSAKEIAQGFTRMFGFAIPRSQPVPEFGVGAGYIVSTAEDMARYALAMKNGAQGLVSEMMGKKIFLPGLGHYGFGWHIVENGGKIFHGGANETFRTDVNLYPKEGRAFVLLINQGHQVDHFISTGQLRDSVEAFVRGRRLPPVSQGWSVRWVGWGMGFLTMGLVILHVHNFKSLRGWKARAQHMTTGKRMWDIGVSFLIPTVILVIVLSQVRAFYGNRFNLWPTLVNLRLVMPDVFILMLVGTLPDYVQGVIKVSMWLKAFRRFVD